MASQVLSGARNASYTNNTGQNVRLIINYMANVTSMTWAEVNVTADSTTIGKDIQNITGEFRTAVTGKILRSSEIFSDRISSQVTVDSQSVARELVLSEGKASILITTTGRNDTQDAKAVQRVYGSDKYQLEGSRSLIITDKTEVYAIGPNGNPFSNGSYLLGPDEESGPDIFYGGNTRNVTSISAGSLFPAETPLSELYTLDGGEGVQYSSGIFYVPTTVSRGGNFPVELMLAPNESFSAVCGAYNAIVIKEDGT